MKKKLSIFDCGLLLLLVLLAFLPFLLRSRNEGTVATVTADGQKITLSLSENKTLTTQDGTVISVENGRISVLHSTCPDGICRTMGPISRCGESIVCVPNKIAITVSSPDAPDSIVG